MVRVRITTLEGLFFDSWCAFTFEEFGRVIYSLLRENPIKNVKVEVVDAEGLVLDVEGVNLEQLEKWRRKVEDCLNPETLNIVVEGDKDDKV